MIGVRLSGLLAAASIGAALPGAQMPAVPLVSIHVAVEDERGRPVANVRPEEFTLLLDNAPVPIVEVSRGARPLRLIVIVDVTTLPKVPDRGLRDAIDRLGATLGESDQAHIWRLGGRITRGPAFTRDPRSRRTAAGFAVNAANAERSGPSPVWDAIVEAAGTLDAHDGRRAIILYTDGRATANRYSGAEAAVRALAADVSVNVVMPAGPSSFRNFDRIVTVHPERMPEAIAHDTGGAFAYAPPRNWSPENGRPPALGDTLAAVVTGLHQEYVLHVVLPDGGPRLVEVRVTRPGLTLRARRAI